MAKDILQAMEAMRRAQAARDARQSAVEIVNEGYTRRIGDTELRRIDEERRVLRGRLRSRD